MKIEYGGANLTAFKVEETRDGGEVNLISIDGRTVEPSPRFWGSLCSQYSSYGMSLRMFKLWTHAEVFQRLTDVLGTTGKERLRYALEDRGAGHPRLLAVTNPRKALLQYERASEVLTRYGARNVEYAHGVVRSTHVPARMDDFEVAGDQFSHQYIMETPIDGYGNPLIYLSLLRQVCTNGMIGYAKAFKSEIAIGRGGTDADTVHSVTRALDSFSNEEGYAALRQRFEAAALSWASIYEVNRVAKTLHLMAQRGMFLQPGVNPAGMVENFAFRRGVVLKLDDTETCPVAIKIMRAFTQLVGDLTRKYGVSHLDAFSRKKMERLISYCTMLELLNFATEIATHYCTESDGRLLQAEVGSLISSEYDLEGSKLEYPTPADFYTDIDTDTIEDN